MGVKDEEEDNRLVRETKEKRMEEKKEDGRKWQRMECKGHLNLLRDQHILWDQASKNIQDYYIDKRIPGGKSSEPPGKGTFWTYDLPYSCEEEDDDDVDDDQDDDEDEMRGKRRYYIRFQRNRWRRMEEEEGIRDRRWQ